MANEADDWLARCKAAFERELRTGLLAVHPTPILMSPTMLAEYEALCAAEDVAVSGTAISVDDATRACGAYRGVDAVALEYFTGDADDLCGLKVSPLPLLVGPGGGSISVNPRTGAVVATENCTPLSDRYPHVCPRCSGPAYVGALEVDCAGGCK